MIEIIIIKEKGIKLDLRITLFEYKKNIIMNVKKIIYCGM